MVWFVKVIELIDGRLVLEFSCFVFEVYILNLCVGDFLVGFVFGGSVFFIRSY